MVVMCQCKPFLAAISGLNLQLGKSVVRVFACVMMIGIIYADLTHARSRGSDSPIQFDSGSVTVEYIHSAYDQVNPDSTKEAQEGGLGQSGKLNFKLNAGFVAGKFSIDGYGQVPSSLFLLRNGDRVNNGVGNAVDLYDVDLKHVGDNFDLNFFYHVPRYHWGFDGDYFGLLQESTSIGDADQFSQKAPVGVEYVGKGAMDGLTIVAGPEVYWGAPTQAIARYRFGANKRYSVLASKEADSEAFRLSLQGTRDLNNEWKLRAGVLMAGNEKVGQTYTYEKDGALYENTVKNKDTLSVKGLLTYDLSGQTDLYGAYQYAGLVANSGETVKEFGSSLPYSGLGNKNVLELGAKITDGAYMFNPRVMVRTNLLAANTSIASNIQGSSITPGLALRNTSNDPFAVLGNREVVAAEFYMTYDPTPGTYFYEWNNDDLEDAPFAYNLGLTLMDFAETTDSYLTAENAPINSAILPANLWLAKTKMVFNTDQGNRWIIRLDVGQQQASKEAKPLNDFYALETKYTHQTHNSFLFKYAQNQFGPHDFQREYGVIFPDQLTFGYERLLNTSKPVAKSSVAGTKLFYRTLDERSGDDWADGQNKDMLEIQVYYTYKF